MREEIEKLIQEIKCLVIVLETEKAECINLDRWDIVSRLNVDISEKEHVEGTLEKTIDLKEVCDYGFDMRSSMFCSIHVDCDTCQFKPIKS